MILLFGPTGAGKSMQGQMLAVRQGWKWLSTGQLFRDSNDLELVELLKTGELISDELTYKVFKQGMKAVEENHFANVIVDGFPRNKDQAAWLKGYLREQDKQIDEIIVLEVPEAEILERLAARGRDEDIPETIARRMTIYRQKMYPVLSEFAEEGVKIVHLDGTGSAGEVHDRIFDEVDRTCGS